MKKLVHIEGFWRQENLSHIAGVKGVYFVYSSKYIKAKDVVELSELVYIGKAQNIEKACQDFCQNNFLMDAEKEYVFSYCAIADDDDMKLIHQLLMHKLFNLPGAFPVNTVLILLGDTNFLEPVYQYDHSEELVFVN